MVGEGGPSLLWEVRSSGIPGLTPFRLLTPPLRFYGVFQASARGGLHSLCKFTFLLEHCHPE